MKNDQAPQGCYTTNIWPIVWISWKIWKICKNLLVLFRVRISATSNKSETFLSLIVSNKSIL